MKSSIAAIICCFACAWHTQLVCAKNPEPLTLGPLHTMHREDHQPRRNFANRFTFDVDLPIFSWGAWSGAIAEDAECLNWEATQLPNAESRFGKNSPVTALYVNRLALLDQHYGKSKQARKLFERAMAIEKKDLSTSAQQIIEQLKNIGDMDWPIEKLEHCGQISQSLAREKALRQKLEKAVRLKGYKQNLQGTMGVKDKG